jgi:hypothetical protein
VRPLAKVEKFPDGIEPGMRETGLEIIISLSATKRSSSSSDSESAKPLPAAYRIVHFGAPRLFGVGS